MQNLLMTLLLIASLSSCRTSGAKSSDLLEAPASTNAGSTVVSAEAKCEANGGEYISGYCVCEDGQAINSKTCAQHIKQSYPECYAKGGISKKWDGKNVCMCEHGEIIDPKTNQQSCYELFTAKNKGCAVKLGMLGVEDRACKCMHGTLTFHLGAGQTCRDDFKAKDPVCFEKGGVTKTAGGPCICRDGTYAEGTTKCSDHWFFYTVADIQNAGTQNQGTINQGSQSQGDAFANPSRQTLNGNDGQIGQNNTQCLCSYTNWRGAHYCGIHEVGSRQFIRYSQLGSAGECNLNHCYTHFQDVYQGKCGGNVRPFGMQGSTAGSVSGSSAPSQQSTCECRNDTLFGQNACSLYKDGVRRFGVQVAGGTNCDANFCQSRWGYDPYVREYCPNIR